MKEDELDCDEDLVPLVPDVEEPDRKGNFTNIHWQEFMAAFRNALAKDYKLRDDLARCYAENALSLLPVEPLYGLQVAAALVPMDYNSLKSFLSRHKAMFPARYTLLGPGHRRARMLYAREIILIRERIFRGLL
jgi:hypothetical protein